MRMLLALVLHLHSDCLHMCACYHQDEQTQTPRRTGSSCPQDAGLHERACVVRAACVHSVPHAVRNTDQYPHVVTKNCRAVCDLSSLARRVCVLPFEPGHLASEGILLTASVSGCMHVCDSMVCMYVCMYACMHACMHVYMYACACMDVCMYVCAYVCTRLREHRSRINV